jgi:hypothetical protein
MVLVVATALVLAAVAAGGAIAAQGASSQSGSGVLAQEDRLPLDLLSVGDCFDDPSETGETIDSVPVVPCDQPHHNETYDLFELSGDEYPGDRQVDELASEGCLASFEAYVGERYEDSELEFSHVTPTEEAWDEGQREVICFVYLPTGEKLTGSVRDQVVARDDPSGTAAEDDVPGGAALVLALGLVALVVLQLAALWKIYTKAGEAGWKSLIPFYNVIVLLRIVGRPAWWLLLLLVPLVNLVVLVIVSVDLAKAFGKGVGFMLGLLLLSFVFLPILGFGSARYHGRPTEAAGPLVQ